MARPCKMSDFVHQSCKILLLPYILFFCCTHLRMLFKSLVGKVITDSYQKKKRKGDY